MAKIAGNFLLFICLSIPALIHCEGKVKLTATTMHGSALTTAAVGSPFLLEVTISGIDLPAQSGSLFNLRAASVDKEPTIKGVENFYVRNAGLQMNSINGVSSVIHRYKVRVDQPGTYVLGPAQVENKGNLLSSNVVNIAVAHQEKSSQEVTKEKKCTAFLKLSAEKQRVVVGEKISCRLRFSFKDDGCTKLHSINEGEISGFTLGKKTGPVAGTELVRGEQYAYGQWNWDMYAKQPGDLVLPAYSADMSIKNEELEQHPFAFFFGNSEQKKIYSNSLKISIDQLPVHNDVVDGVGLYSSFVAKLDHSMAKEGEGVVLGLEIEGEGDLENLRAPVLQRIPQDFKWYESKNSVVDGAHGPKKRFEYILQGLKSGTYELPAQTFTYFDVEEREYTTLETAPLTLTIKPNFGKQVVEQAVDAQAKVQVRDDLQPLDKRAWQEDRQWHLPLWLLMIIVAIPFGLLLVRVICLKIERRPLHGKKYALFNLRKSLVQCARTRQYENLYSAFIDFFAQRFGLPTQQVSLEFINEQMCHAHFNEDQLRQWDSFFIALSALTFYAAQAAEGEQMIKQAERWAQLFEEKL